MPRDDSSTPGFRQLAGILRLLLVRFFIIRNLARDQEKYQQCCLVVGSTVIFFNDIVTDDFAHVMALDRPEY